MHRRADVIWTPDQDIDESQVFRVLVRDGPAARDDGVNRWYLFRRAFDLAAAPTKARVRITADSRYQLFANGARVGRGPVRSAGHIRRFDVYDVADALRPGRNVFAVLVHVYGVDTAWYERDTGYPQCLFGDGGLWLEADIAGAGDAPIEILTDGSWRVHACRAWAPDAPRSGWGQGFIEDVDATRLPDGWSDTDFDDAAWPHARVQRWDGVAYERTMGWGPHELFPLLLENDLPALDEAPQRAERVRAIHTIVPDPTLPVDRRLYEEAFEPPTDGLTENLDALLRDDDAAAVLRTTDTRDVCVLLDFGRIHTGYPFIEIEAAGGEAIELAAAEGVPGDFADTAPAEPRLRRLTHLDCAQIVRYRARPGVQRFEKFDWTAVRYLQLVVRDAPQGLKVRRIGSVRTRYPAEPLGRFTSSDPFLDRLWEIGRYTALQCTHDAWSDGPGREKRQWFGDGLIHYLVSAAAFGPSTRAVDRQFFRAAAECQRADGLIQMFGPGDHHRNGITIPDYSLQWICGAKHHLLHAGDLDFLAEVFPAMERALAWFVPHVDAAGLLADLPHWRFVEWADVDRSGECAAINLFYHAALRAAAAIAAAIGYDRACATYSGRAAALAAAFNARLWNAERGLYADAADPATGALSPRVSQQVNAIAIVEGLAPVERWADMIARFMDPAAAKLTAVPPIVTGEGPFDEARNVVRANTYLAHFVYEALARAGRFDLALAAMRANFGPMLDAGATTLWESYEPSASLCHAFSASPVYQLSAHALGVRPTAPGFSRFEVEPSPGDLAFVEGVYPTPAGGVEVSWRRDGEALHLDVQAPGALTGDVVAPPGWRVASGGGPFTRRAAAMLVPEN